MRTKSGFLSFSRRERYGNSFLILLFLLLCLFPGFLPELFSPLPLPEKEVGQQLVHFILPDTQRQNAGLQKADTLFFFDPNIAGKEEFLQLGLSERTAQTIINYREKGGRFRKKEDFSRIYSISQSDYERLAPYIAIPEREEKKQPYEKKGRKDTDALRIDVNRATAEEWQQLRGIGPGYAGRIIRFREKLGGFVSIEQISHTYGLPDSVFQTIRPQLEWSPIFRPLPVNRATEEELAEHPYLSKKQARVLVLYRQNHGPFHQLEDLQPIRALPDTTLQKLAPYLSFEPAL